ncbi:MAG: hypothetical protein M9894_01615 [Planctomycetes bacterium]|nr:hypothetical protein [Planctomycetota bacterium]
MSDDGLRAVEARWRQTGAPEDEAAWLVARVRAGALPPERLRLAARLGHRAAGLAVGAAAEPLPTCEGEMVPWLRRVIAPVGLEPLVRVAVVMLRALLARLPDAPWIEVNARPALEAAEAWCACPCPDHAARAAEEARRARVRCDAADDASAWTGEQGWSSDVVEHAHEVVASIAIDAGLFEGPGARYGWPADAEGRLLDASEFMVGLPANDPPAARELSAAIAKALIAWALDR